MLKVWSLIPLLIVSTTSLNFYAMHPGSLSNLVEHMAVHSPETLPLIVDKAERTTLPYMMLGTGLCGTGGMTLGVMIARSCCMHDPTLLASIAFVSSVVGLCLFGFAGAYGGLKLGQACVQVEHGTDENEP